MKCLVPACDKHFTASLSFCEPHLAAYLDHLALEGTAAREAMAAEVQSADGRARLLGLPAAPPARPAVAFRMPAMLATESGRMAALSVVGAVLLVAFIMGTSQLVGADRLAIAPDPAPPPPAPALAATPWKTRVVSDVTSPAATYHLITRDTRVLGFTAGGIFYPLGMPASEFKTKFGVPNSEDDTHYEYFNEGITVTLKSGRLQGVRFCQLPSDGFNVAKLDVDRGFNLHQTVAALSAVYQSDYQVAGNEVIFRCPTGHVRYGFKFGLIASVSLESV